MLPLKPAVEVEWNRERAGPEDEESPVELVGMSERPEHEGRGYSDEQAHCFMGLIPGLGLCSLGCVGSTIMAYEGTKPWGWFKREIAELECPAGKS